MDNDLFWLRRGTTDVQETEPERPARCEPGGRGWAALLAAAERSCCCPAQPMVVAVLAPRGPRREVTELLFCLHHYRVAQDALNAAGAVVFDKNGMVVTSSLQAVPASWMSRQLSAV